MQANAAMVALVVVIIVLAHVHDGDTELHTGKNDPVKDPEHQRRNNADG